VFSASAPISAACDLVMADEVFAALAFVVCDAVATTSSVEDSTLSSELDSCALNGFVAPASVAAAVDFEKADACAATKPDTSDAWLTIEATMPMD
jgi:hypothetical protein